MKTLFKRSVLIALVVFGGLSLSSGVTHAQLLMPSSDSEVGTLRDSGVADSDSIVSDGAVFASDDDRRAGERRDEEVDIIVCCGGGGFTPGFVLQSGYVDIPDVLNVFEMPFVVQLDVHKRVKMPGSESNIADEYSHYTRYVLGIPGGPVLNEGRTLGDHMQFWINAVDDKPPLIPYFSDGHLNFVMEVIYEVTIDPFDQVSEGSGEENNTHIWLFRFWDALGTPEIEQPLGFLYQGDKNDLPEDFWIRDVID